MERHLLGETFEDPRGQFPVIQATIFSLITGRGTFEDPMFCSGGVANGIGGRMNEIQNPFCGERVSRETNASRLAAHSFGRHSLIAFESQ